MHAFEFSDSPLIGLIQAKLVWCTLELKVQDTLDKQKCIQSFTDIIIANIFYNY